MFHPAIHPTQNPKLSSPAVEELSIQGHAGADDVLLLTEGKRKLINLRTENDLPPDFNCDCFKLSNSSNCSLGFSM